MPDLPSVPFFSYSPGPRGSFLLEDEAATKTMATRLGLMQEEDAGGGIYDSDGRVWKCSMVHPPVKRGFFSKLSAEFYNPMKEVDLSWTYLRDYPFEELRQAYLDALEHDDDGLTQFYGGDDIIERIEKCNDFKDLVDVYEWASTDAPDH